MVAAQQGRLGQAPQGRRQALELGHGLALAEGVAEQLAGPGPVGPAHGQVAEDVLGGDPGGDAAAPVGQGVLGRPVGQLPAADRPLHVGQVGGHVVAVVPELDPLGVVDAGGQPPLGPVVVLLRRRVDLVGRVDLTRVQHPLAVEAQRRRALGHLAERVDVADLQERPVDRLQVVHARGHEDPHQDVVEGIAGDVGCGEASCQVRAGPDRHLAAVDDDCKSIRSDSHTGDLKARHPPVAPQPRKDRGIGSDVEEADRDVGDHHRRADRHAPQTAAVALAERLGFLEVLLCALLIDLSGRRRRVAYHHVRQDCRAKR